jgi:predicted dehydrogenase
VYVEKPLADTEAECAAVVAAQQKTGKFAVVGFNRRRAPAYLKAREALHAHGGPVNIHYRISDEYWYWGAKFPPGERVIHEVCHVFDILRWFTGADVRTVYCRTSAQPDDEFFALEFTSGCIATIMSSGLATMDLPKERFEAIARGKGGVIVEEFTELRTFGFKDYEDIYLYPGHSHPDRDFDHKYLYGKLGAPALLAMRRMGWEIREKNAAPADPAQPDRREMETFMTDRAPHWNYMVDKGWLAAIDHFAKCVLTGAAPQLAGARDGLMASVLSHAAIKSRATGEVVTIKS